MSDAARLVEKYYLGPAIRLIDSEWAKVNIFHAYESFYTYEINTTIWRTEHLPEYRVSIPESATCDGIYGSSESKFTPTFETRKITYVPTGRVVYDTSLPDKSAIVYEYILEALLGKKDLKHI